MSTVNFNWNVSESNGRIEYLTIEGSPELMRHAAAHEYGIWKSDEVFKHYPPYMRRQLRHFISMSGTEYTKENGWDVYTGSLVNQTTKKDGDAIFVNKFKEENGTIRLKARREWIGDVGVYDDSLFFIMRASSFLRTECKKCRRTNPHPNNCNCPQCPTFDPWWSRFTVYNPNGDYQRWFSIIDKTKFYSKHPFTQVYLRSKSYKDCDVFTHGIKGSYAEAIGPRYGIRLEILDTDCELAQLRIVGVKNHSYFEFEFQYDNNGPRSKGDVYNVDCRITPIHFKPSGGIRNILSKIFIR